MSRVRATVGPGGHSLILRLLAAGREVSAVAGSRTRAAEARAVLDARRVLAGAQLPFNAADRDDDAGRLDAVAGSEFVDDRIRLRE